MANRIVWPVSLRGFVVAARARTQSWRLEVPLGGRLVLEGGLETLGEGRWGCLVVLELCLVVKWWWW